MYTLSHKGRILLGVNKREDKIRVDRITHDIYIIEAIIYFVLKYGVGGGSGWWGIATWQYNCKRSIHY